MNGLSTINIELTSRCNKSCWMCGRRKMERENPELCDWGDMPLDMLKDIRYQVPKGITVQFHNNGESLLYPELRIALRMFNGYIRCLNTNAKLLYEKANDIIGNLETITISVIEKDPEAEDQFETVCKFLEKKGEKKPAMVYRLLGEVEKHERWEALQGVVARRILHAPEGSFGYKKTPTIPEIGICLDLLNHLVIDRYGNISPCVRYDPNKHAILGNIKNGCLEGYWYGGKRTAMIEDHIAQRREKWMLCKACRFWGVPKS